MIRRGGTLFSSMMKKGEKVNDAIEVEGKGINSRVIEGLESGTDYLLKFALLPTFMGITKIKSSVMANFQIALK